MARRDGAYGELTLEEDGSFEYQLDNDSSRCRRSSPETA